MPASCGHGLVDLPDSDLPECCRVERNRVGDRKLLLCGVHARWLRAQRARRALSHDALAREWLRLHFVATGVGLDSPVASFGAELLEAASERLFEDLESWDADLAVILEGREDPNDEG